MPAEKEAIENYRRLVQEQIIKRVREKVSDIEVTLDSDFRTNLGIDSLNIVELAYYLEQDFKIQVPDQDLLEINTPRQAIDYVLKRKFPNYQPEDYATTEKSILQR